MISAFRILLLVATLVATTAAPAAHGAAPPVSPKFTDIQGVDLISTGSYDPRKESGRVLKEFFSGLGALFAGPGTDLTKTLQDKLDNPALRTYFPDAAERRQLAQTLANDVKLRYLSHGFTNSTVDAALKYATDRLIGTVVVRVLMKEGVKDVNRAGAWADRIKAPFDRCMGLVVSYLEAQKCGTPLESDLMKNVGLALSYELTKQEFGAPKVAAYKSCLRPTEAGADNRVRDCSLQNVRSAASEVGRARVTAEAKKQMPAAAATALANKVMPAFDQCLKAAKDRPGFLACGDKLIGSAGASIAEQAIRNDKRVATYFPNASDRDRVAATGRDAFARCMADNLANNRRDSSGSLLTDNCVSFVTLEASKTVAIEVFRTTLAQNLPTATAAERDAILQGSKAQLDKCWNSGKPEPTNATCLRGVARQLALDVADKTLQQQLPADAQDPALRRKVLSGFGACLDQKLPADPIKQDGADTAAGACAASAFRDAALGVAEAKVRAVLDGKVTDPAAVDAIVATLVRKNFSDCLGDQPKTDKLNACTLDLERGVALQAAEALLPARVDQFFQAGGGLAAYGLDEKGRQSLLDGTFAVHQDCLKAQVKGTDTAAVESSINDCFKGTIRELSLKLGTLEFQKAAKTNGVDVTTKDFKQVAQDFLDGFGACLDKKKDPKFSLDDYLGGLEACQAEITKSTTTQVAKNELATTVKQLLGDAGADLQKSLLADFDHCMAAAKTTTDSNACVASLKGSATVKLAEVGVHQRAAKELGLPEAPSEITSLDAQLDGCAADKQKVPDDCAVAYVKSATEEIGHLKVEATLRPMLGDAKMTKLAPALAALEAPFKACIQAVPAPLNQKMLDAFEACGNQLTIDGMEFLLKHSLDGAAENPTPSPPPAPAPAPKTPPPALSEGQLSDMMARTFLCLNGSLEPGQEQGLQNLEPGSVEDKLVQLIGAYVNYDLKNADGRYEEVLGAVSDELNAAGPDAAKKKLVDLLVQKGMADQLLKAMVKRELEKSIAALPDGQLPKEISAKLTDKATLDQALGDEAMLKLRPLLTSGVLQPVLVDGKALDSSPVLRAFRDVRAQAVEAVLASPAAGLDDAAKAQVRTALKK